MKITLKQLRRILIEALEQDLRGNLDPKPGQMAAMETHEPVKDYLLWTKVNGLNASKPSSIESYAREKDLELSGVEINKIVKDLRLQYNTVSNIQKQEGRSHKRKKTYAL